MDYVSCCKRVKMSLGNCCSFLSCYCCVKRNYPIAEVGGEEEVQYLVSLEREGSARSTEVMETRLDSQEIDGESGSELGEEKEGEVLLEREGGATSTEVIEPEHSDSTSELRGREGERGRGDEQTSPLPAHEETALLSVQIESELAQSEGTPTAERSRAAEPNCEGTPLLETEVNNETESARAMSKPCGKKGRGQKRSSRQRSGENVTQSDERNHSLIPVHPLATCLKGSIGVERMNDCSSSSGLSVFNTGKSSQRGFTVFEQNLSVNQTEIDPRDGGTVELPHHHQYQGDVKFACKSWEVLSSKVGSSTVEEQLDINFVSACLPHGVATTKIIKKVPCSGDEGYCSRQVSRQDSQKESEDSTYRFQVDRQKSSGLDSAIGDTSGSDSDGA